jgi:hypothetical protein
MNDCEQQAADFAKKVGLTMNTLYLGHYKRLGDFIVANYRITLKRGGEKFRFDFSTSVNDSWCYKEGGSTKLCSGIPQILGLDSFFNSPEALKETFSYLQYTVKRCEKPPTLYDVLACLTKYDPGPHEYFCGDYGYAVDSVKGLETYLAVQKEWHCVLQMFGDVMEEFCEIQ